MNKSYYSLGLMSGTSGDGVDASIIQSDGDTKYKVISDRYFKYNQYIYENIHNLKDKIKNSKDLISLSKEIDILENEITLFHFKAASDFIKDSKVDIDFIGFHGQTIFHNSKEKISKQLGDGKLLSKLMNKIIITNFRQKDLNNGGKGAPLAPIFHKVMAQENKIYLPVIILNIGGVANVTCIDIKKNIFSTDIGPGNCLIDKWIRLNSGKKYDDNGKIAKSGKINKKILHNVLKNWRFDNSHLSYDIKDFNFSFVRNLSLKDGAATLTEYTSEIIFRYLKFSPYNFINKIVACGGGRKNKFLVNSIENKINKKIKMIDEFGVDGDFVESQAFAYLAIRSYLKLPISFPSTTGTQKPCSGGLVNTNKSKR